MNFTDYIKGKKVCFVGPSAIMKGRGLGEFIDTFDVVARTNGSIYLLENDEYQKDYGKKIDILYTNNQFYREMSPLPIDAFSTKGVKYLRMKTCKKNDLENFRKKIQCEIIKNAILNVNQYNPSATMGSYILRDILNHNPCELYVTGISFFSLKKKVFEHDNYQEYFDGYLPDKIRKQGNEINKGKKEDGHNFDENAKYFYKLWKENDNLIFSDFVEKILIGIMNGEVKQK